MITDGRKLMDLYDRGVLTRGGLAICVAQAATAVEPSEMAAHLPHWVLDELRAKAGEPPGRVFGSVCALPGFDAEAHFREETRLHADGLRRWADYFAAARCRPEGASGNSPG